MNYSTETTGLATALEISAARGASAIFMYNHVTEVWS